MRTADIKVGTDYAYRSSTYARASKVTVLETGVERTQGGYSWNRRAVKNGVRVRWGNGSEGIVSSREISQPWAEEAEQQRLANERRRQVQEQERETATRRARQARVLEDHLAGHGIEARRRITFLRPVDRRALGAAGFVFEDGEPVTRLSNLGDFMRRGNVPLSDLTPVLADIEMQQKVS